MPLAERDDRSPPPRLHLVRGAAVDAPSDAQLVARCLAGTAGAEEALYRRHVHRVTGVAKRLLRHGPDVEDVVQDTFIQAFGKLETLRAPERLGAWLVTLAVNRIRKRFRRRRLRRLLGLERSFDDEGLVLQAHAQASQEARAELALLDRALDRLSSEDRICWVLRSVEGYTLDEVAALSGCSLSTAKRRIARGQSVVDGLRAERAQ